MPIRLLQLADLHLGAHGAWLGKRAEARRKDFQTAFERAVDFALAEQNTIDAVVICGDLFDSHRPPPALVKLVAGACGRLQAADKPVIILPGLHDGIAYPDCVYYTETFPGAHVFLDPNQREPLSFNLQNTACHFYGLPIREGTALPPLFKRTDVSGVHIGLLHGSLPASPDFERFSKKVVFDPEDLAETGMDYIALGHYHNYQVHTHNFLTMAYSGSLEATGFGDTEPRAFLIAEFERSGGETELTLSQVPYEGARRVLDAGVEVAGCESTAAVITKILEMADEAALARVVLSGPSEFVVDLDAVREAVRSAFFFVELEDATTLSRSGLVRVLETEPTIRGMFAKQILQQADGPSGKVLEVALKAGLRRFLEEELL